MSDDAPRSATCPDSTDLLKLAAAVAECHDVGIPKSPSPRPPPVLMMSVTGAGADLSREEVEEYVAKIKECTRKQMSLFQDVEKFISTLGDEPPSLPQPPAAAVAAAAPAEATSTPGSNTGSPPKGDSRGRRRTKKKEVLPAQATELMRRWLAEHLDAPYPSDAQKKELAAAGGIATNQVTTWFINARCRILPKLRSATSGPTEGVVQPQQQQQQSPSSLSSSSSSGSATQQQGDPSVH